MKAIKPTYEELQKMLEYERSIKDSLYYFLTFKNQMQSYVCWAMATGVDNMSNSTKSMQMFKKIHAMQEVYSINNVQLLNGEYTISPN
jgi:hypothetical protein